MFERPTRLELVIVVTALLVLLFCSRPPTSGNADVRFDAGQFGGQATLDPMQPETGGPAVSVESSSASPADAEAVPAGDAIASDGLPVDVPPPPKIRRLATVDARNAPNLDYKDVMYGEVKVRWVWNGQKLVPCKVCEVKEANGVVSVWSFDENENIILSELPPEQVPAD